MNKFGLSRYIPEAVKKKIRRRCGFGCVICGNAVVTYEHIDPLWSEARTHDPDHMTLLCGDHQIQSSKGLLSKDTIKDADANPCCKRSGYAKHALDLGSARPKLLIGGNDFTNCGPGVRLEGETLFQVSPPEKKSHRWRLSARFKDPAGLDICTISENELLLNAGNFDITQTTIAFRISDATGTILLGLEAHPPDGLILTNYKLVTPRGEISIAETDVPDDVVALLPPNASKKETTLTFKTTSSELRFSNGGFANPNGIELWFNDNGDLVFGHRHRADNP